LFFWMTLWKNHPWTGWQNLQMVSILVFLDDALKVRACIGRSPDREFQSLFFWMTLWKLSDHGSPSMHRSSFNPCFSGWRSESLTADGSRKQRDQFQSLFFWMTLWKPDKWIRRRNWTIVSILVFLDDALKVSVLVAPDVSRPSFNPCFSGWRSERWDRQSEIPGRSLFQSLFFWMTLWKWCGITGREVSPQSFNPCFSGWRSESLL